MRELGHGDVSVNKKMKLLNKIFYNILLKLEKKKMNKFSINNTIIIEHLLIDISPSDELLSKIIEYYLSFYNYCFELDDNSMIQGKINFKF